MILFLPDFSMLELNGENPSAVSTVYALVMSLVLSVLISFTYEKTSKHIKAPGHFIQSMILGAIIATVVTIAIGDSIGRGLGMLGIMAMIRFRTNIAQPRNIIFLFSALGVGIACGVFAFNVALYGGIFFCLVAFILVYSPFAKFYKSEHLLKLIFPIANSPSDQDLQELFLQYNIQAKLTRTDVKKVGDSFESEMLWELSGFDANQYIKFIQSLNQSFKTTNVRLTMKYDEQLV